MKRGPHSAQLLINECRYRSCLKPVENADAYALQLLQQIAALSKTSEISDTKRSGEKYD
jgi:hypothetical protein